MIHPLPHQAGVTGAPAPGQGSRGAQNTGQSIYRHERLTDTSEKPSRVRTLRPGKPVWGVDSQGL